MLNKKLELIRLRQLNCGYNLEKADTIGKVSRTGSLLFINYKGHSMVFVQIDVKDELEFLQKYFHRYGVEYQGSIFIQQDDY